MSRNSNDNKTALHAMHSVLLRWYAKNGRKSLPWRNTSDPYAIYISEVMLQQTQVKTVLERYYFPFLERFPTLKTLADAPEQDVLKCWEGLGYYSRARNLHKAAQVCGGTLPSTVEGLMTLPGIGRNTAHAVACFGFGAEVPVMEANVKRVLCRVFAMPQPDEKLLFAHAAELLDTAHAFDYNQAMMDIGAMICTKRSPRCGECPLASLCKGQYKPENYPASKAKKIERVRALNLIVCHNSQRKLLMEKRTTRFLGGLYGFPERDTGEKHITIGSFSFSLESAHLIGQVRQVYSHFTLEGKVWLVKWPEEHLVVPDNAQWVTLEEAESMPLSRADSKVCALVEAYTQTIKNPATIK